MVVTFDLQCDHRRFASMSLFRYFSPVSKPYLPNPEEEGTSSEASEVQTINNVLVNVRIQIFITMPRFVLRLADMPPKMATRMPWKSFLESYRGL